MGRREQFLPLFASERGAARLLDMTPTEFRGLVDAGALPQPCSFERWDVAQLEAIMRGTKPKPAEDFDL
jgi:hypothetical protein